MISKTIIAVRLAILINREVKRYYGKEYNRSTTRNPCGGAQKRHIASKAGSNESRAGKSTS